MTSSQGNFVRDEHGHRIDGFGEKARRIVAASFIAQGRSCAQMSSYAQAGIRP